MAKLKTRYTRFSNGALDEGPTDAWGGQIHRSFLTGSETKRVNQFAQFQALYGTNIADWQYWQPVTGLATSDFSSREGHCCYIRRSVGKGKWRIAIILESEKYLFPNLDEFQADPGFEQPAETPREIRKELAAEDNYAVGGYNRGDRGDRAFDAAEMAKKAKLAADRQAAREANEAALEEKITASRRAAYERAGIPFPEGSQPGAVKRRFIDKAGASSEGKASKPDRGYTKAEMAKRRPLDASEAALEAAIAASERRAQERARK